MLNWIYENHHPHPFGLSSPNGRIEVSAEARAPADDYRRSCKRLAASTGIRRDLKASFFLMTAIITAREPLDIVISGSALKVMSSSNWSMQRDWFRCLLCFCVRHWRGILSGLGDFPDRN